MKSAVPVHRCRVCHKKPTIPFYMGTYHAICSESDHRIELVGFSHAVALRRWNSLNKPRSKKTSVAHS